MVTAKLICVFVFAYADCWFSHEAAQITRQSSYSGQYDFVCPNKHIFCHVEMEQTLSNSLTVPCGVLIWALHSVGKFDSNLTTDSKVSGSKQYFAFYVTKTTFNYELSEIIKMHFFASLC